MRTPGRRRVPNWATGIAAGPADESGQALTFLVTTDNNGLFSVPGRRRQRDPDLHAGRERQRVGDGDGPSAGQRRHGQRRRGHRRLRRRSRSRSHAVNDAPVLDNGGDMAVTAILEDETGERRHEDHRPHRERGRRPDHRRGRRGVEGLAITAADTANGVWEYS